MPEIINQQQSTLLNNRATLHIAALPGIEFYTNTFELPGLTNAAVLVENPFVVAKEPSEKVVFEDLTVELNCDKDLRQWRAIFDWMVGHGFPDAYTQYNHKISEATLTIYTNLNNPQFQVNFREIFPVSLGSLNFTPQTTDATILTFSVTFTYLLYEIKPV